jgi:hypothetical protein
MDNDGEYHHQTAFKGTVATSCTCILFNVKINKKLKVMFGAANYMSNDYGNIIFQNVSKEWKRGRRETVFLTPVLYPLG